MPGRLQTRRTARTLAGGGLIAYPTESVFGFGCDPLDAGAIARLIALKGRDATRGFILLGGARAQLEPWMGPVDDTMRKRLDESWPGPVTWVAPAAPWVPRILTGGRDTLALRFTAHRLAADLALAAGTAIVSTSANRSGRAPARSAVKVRRLFGEAVDDILAGATGGLDRPTEIRDLRTGKVLRAGQGG
jgi:L-threonylcarbamoyladenylate synthase